MNPQLALLFSHLNKYGINYFLLTDFESDLKSNDIDLYIHPTNRTAFEEAIFKLGWYRRKEPAHHVNHYFYYTPKSEIYLDVKFSLTFANGTNLCCTYPNTGRSTLNSKGICRPTGIDAIMLYAAHLAYKERGKLEEKHRDYLQKYISIYRPELDNSSSGVVGQLQEWLTNYFPDTKSLQQIIRPHFTTDKKRMTRPAGIKYGYGLSVLFLGTDGVGKTTLVEAVSSRLNLKHNRLYLGAGESSWSSHFMKRIYEHQFKVRPLNKLYNLVRTFAVLPLELSIRIAPVIKKSKYNITLIDRFPGFVFLDNKPVRALLYKSVLPDPDLVFFLHADPAVLVKRKPNETTVERSRHDMQRFEKVANIVSKGKYKSIDTSALSIEEATDQIISEIYSHPKLYKNLLTTEPCD